jgi:hypothetical protein
MIIKLFEKLKSFGIYKCWLTHFGIQVQIRGIQL